MPLGKKVNFNKARPNPQEIYELYCKNTGLEFNFYFISEDENGANKAYGISDAQFESMQKMTQVELCESLEELSNDAGVLSFEHSELGSFMVEYVEEGLSIDTPKNVFGYLEWAMMATLYDLGADDDVPESVWYRKPWEHIQSQEGISEKLAMLEMKEMEMLAYKSMFEKNLNMLIQDVTEFAKLKIYAGTEDSFGEFSAHNEDVQKDTYAKLLDTIDKIKNFT